MFYKTVWADTAADGVLFEINSDQPVIAHNEKQIFTSINAASNVDLLENKITKINCRVPLFDVIYG